LYKTKFQAEPIDKKLLIEKKKEICQQLAITEEDAAYFVFSGEASNTTYNIEDERINILFKDGTIKDISQVDNALIQHNLSGAVKKYYFCYYKV
jgi:uncharacterized protein